MLDPVAQLAPNACGTGSSDDGLLYLELPNIEAEAAVRPRGELFDLGHVYNFNPTTMRVALAVAGFSEADETRERSIGTATAGFLPQGRAAKNQRARRRGQRPAGLRRHHPPLRPRHSRP